ncbi:MAG TPA: UDP-glucose/GDP-mannose dehydrogenase family protein [Candidatus Nanopelagicaceae bacterium]|nr:UDP-glucose/GDP-mannose dehydrogenase family protein [Candidatus Nanopelagicaceae bacterium]
MTAATRGRDGRPTPSRIAVIGAGHVGLPTAAALVSLGHRVCCAESDPERLEILRSGRVPIFEEGLLEVVEEGRRAGRLSFVGTAGEAVQSAEFTFLCVPTPERSDGSADLSYLERAAQEAGPHLRSGAIVVNKSTVPIGSTRLVEQTIARGDVTVVSNPEFLREGTAVQDSLRPDRIVVGADNQDAAARVGALFASTGAPLVVTDAATAETIKYVANTFLATKLSFMNAVAGLCDAVGADVRDVILGLGYDRRIGFDFLRPGPGWGGSCFPKDTHALLHIANEAGFDFPLLRTVIETNAWQIGRMVGKLERALRDEFQLADSEPALPGRTVAAWGLTFKAGTDDLRESPALRVVSQVLAEGAAVRAFDPTLPSGDPAEGAPEPLRREWRSLGFPESQLDRLTVCGTSLAACDGAAALLVLTEWEEFRAADLHAVRDHLLAPVIVDARNLLDPGAARAAGFRYVGVGRP